MTTTTTTPPRATRVIKRLDPARPGARRWVATYADALVCVRYRIDPERQERQTTVELIGDRAPTLASLPVGLRVARAKIEVGREVSQVRRRPLGDARQLGLTARIVSGVGHGRDPVHTMSSSGQNHVDHWESTTGR